MQVSRNSSSKKQSQQILLTQYLNKSTARGGGGGGGVGSNTAAVAVSTGSTGGSAATSNATSSNQVASQAQQNQQQQQQQQQQLPTSSSVRDIVNLRKQIVSHPWFISMEDTLNKQYIPSKSLRKFKQNLNNLQNNDITKINTESLLQSGQLSSFPFELPQHTTGGQLTFLATATVNSRGNIDGNSSNNNINGINLTNPSASLLNFMKSEKAISSSIPSILSNNPSNATNISVSNISEDPELEFEKPEMKNFSYTYAYTQQDRKKEITIKLHDLKKLLPNQYLNDSIVNFFLKFFEVEMLTEQMQEKVLIFNTYFMSKLAPNEQVDSINSSEPVVMQPLFEKNYQTWIKEDIFEKDFLVFPLNLPEHWSVAIVCNHRKLLAEQKEKISKKKEEKEQKRENSNKKVVEEEVDLKQGEKGSAKGKESIVAIEGKEQESQKMEVEVEQEKDKKKENNSLTEPTTTNTSGNGNIATQVGQSSSDEASNKETIMEIEDKRSTGVDGAATVSDSTKAQPADKLVVVSDEKAAVVAANTDATGTEITAIQEEEVVAVAKIIKKDSPVKTAGSAVDHLKASVNNDDDDDYSSDSDSSSYSEIDQTDNQNPCILYFDSFGLLDAKYSTMIRLYIQRELTHKLKQLQDKHNSNNDGKQEQPQKHIEVNEITLPSRQPLIPRQTNYVDCGLYLLEYVEDFLNSTATQRSVFTSNSSDDWVQLNWFPRCNITSKRRFIKELILDLSALPVTQSVQNYKQKRKQLLDERSGKSEEYDEVDMEEFEDHLEDIIESEYDYPETDMERHRMLLDFYMNPSYNKYEVV